jgi:hypothetical protein
MRQYSALLAAQGGPRSSNRSAKVSGVLGGLRQRELHLATKNLQLLVTVMHGGAHLCLQASLSTFNL